MLVDVVRRIEFRQCLRGYDIDEVDNFLEVVASELEAGRPIRWQCEHASFRTTLRGYDRADVDRFIRQLANEPLGVRNTWEHRFSSPAPTEGADWGKAAEAERFSALRIVGRLALALAVSVLCLGSIGLGIAVFVSHQVDNAHIARYGVTIEAKVVDRWHDDEGDSGVYDYLYVHVPQCNCRVQLGTTNLAGHPIGSRVPVRSDPRNP